ncbi:response regulator [Duganella sp. SAP-35]|uniref:Response regulator n=2 Tax=Duganella aceris TaxID=2703883 RepID=A0ABX0FNL6_9BURK|nr:response regulator [Duganella aceris]
MLRELLQLEGHQVTVAYGARHGLEKLRALSPEIVFIDIGMPEMNGYELAAVIRRDEGLQQPYLIAFTAWDDMLSISSAIKAGFDRHLKKTSSFEQLMSAVREIGNTPLATV